MSLADKVVRAFEIRLSHQNMTSAMAKQERYDRTDALIREREDANAVDDHFRDYAGKVMNWHSVQTAHMIRSLGGSAREVILRLDTSDEHGIPQQVQVYFFHRSILEAFFTTEKTGVSDILEHVRALTLADVYDVQDEYDAVTRSAIMFSYRKDEFQQIADTSSRNTMLKEEITNWFTVEEMMNALLLIQYSETIRYEAKTACLEGLNPAHSGKVLEPYTRGRSVLQFLIDEVKEILYSYTFQVAEEGYADVPPQDDLFYNLIDMMEGFGVVDDKRVLYNLGGVTHETVPVDGESTPISDD